MNLLRAGIVGLGSAVPDRILTNQDLEKIVDTSDEWIRTRTGIKERHLSDPDMPTSALGTMAARQAITDAKISPLDIDLVIVATISPDMTFPSTAGIVQANIGAKNAAAFDLNAGCSGFVYALSVGEQFIRTGIYKTVLVIGADELTKQVNWTDRNTCVLFGDGAGAVILKAVAEDEGIRSVYLGADGDGAELLKIEGGGTRRPFNKEVLDQKLYYIQMTGNEVYKFAVNIMGEASLKALELAGMDISQIDLFVPHQANIRIIDAAAKRLGLPPEKVYINVDRYGNTSAATIPIALDDARKENRLHKGDIIILVGFGAGLTWAASVVKWSI